MFDSKSGMIFGFCAICIPTISFFSAKKITQIIEDNKQAKIMKIEFVGSQYLLSTITNINSNEIPNNLINTDGKNYECIFDGGKNKNNKLKSCQIFKSKNVDNKAIDWRVNDIFKKTENLLDGKSDITNNAKVFLILEKEDYEQVKDKKIISVYGVKTEKSDGKKYFDIKINQNFNLSQKEGLKANLMIVKVISNNVNSKDMSQLTCKFNRSNAKNDCFIYQITDTLSPGNTATPIIGSDFSSAKQKCQNASLNKGTYALLKITDDSMYEKQLDSRTIEVYTGQKVVENNKIMTVEYQKALINDLPKSADCQKS